MVKRNYISIIALAFIGLSANVAKAQMANPDGTWVGGTWTLENRVLTISGTGTIPNQCFDGVYNVSHVVVNEGITGIGFGVWYHTSVESPILTYDIPASVTTMHSYALYGGRAITQITVHWTETLPAITDADGHGNHFGISQEGGVSAITLSVPHGTSALYQAAAEWQDFNIVERSEAAGINEIAKDELQILIVNGELKIENYAGGAVQIFDATGRTVGARLIAPLHTPAHNGTQTITISHLPAGVYLVKAGNKAGKFVKR